MLYFFLKRKLEKFNFDFFFSSLREIPKWERAYCWILMLTGLLGGIAATYVACENIFYSEITLPCWWPGAEVKNIGGSHG